MNFNAVKKEIDEAQFVLVGLGEEWETDVFSEKVKKAYEALERLLSGKNYFIVTTASDDFIFQTGLLEEKIAAPFGNGAGSSEERWQSYLNWLMDTLNRKLLLLELGEGFGNPSVIRWPFEKTAELNLKSSLYRVHEKFYQLPENLGERGKSEAKNSVDWILEEDAEDTNNS